MSTKRTSIGNKLAGLDMAPFDSRKKDANNAVQGAQTADPGGRTHTGVGVVIGAISEKAQLERKLSEVKVDLDEANRRLSEYQGADAVLSLDPKTIRRSQWANRVELNFSGADWSAFKDEIESSGGNVEPIKVRRVVFYGKTASPSADHNDESFEIVFGHRRHQACLELGIPVKALVAEIMDDRALFAEMDRENRGRQNLSAWEQGRMYRKALQEGLYPSIRQLSQELGVNLSNAARSCKLAELPDEVIQAFPSPLTLQVRWAKDLSDAVQRDPTGILIRAKSLAAERGKLLASEVLARLMSKSEVTQHEPIQISASGRPAALLKMGAKGRATVEFQPGVLAPDRQQALAKLISEFLSSSQ